MLSVLIKYRQSVFSSEIQVRDLLNAQNQDGNTPWNFAILFNRAALLRLFLNYKPDLSVKNAEMATLFHSIAMWADVETLSVLDSINISAVDLLCRDRYGSTAMEMVEARLREDPFWAYCPPYSEGGGVALVRFVAHARQFEPRLPRLLYGVKRGEEEYSPDYGLFSPTNEMPEITDERTEWVDVEEWVSEHGDLDFRAAWERSSLEGESGDEWITTEGEDSEAESENSEVDSGESDGEEEEVFFDATDP